MSNKTVIIDDNKTEYIVYVKKSKRRSIGYVVKRDGRLELKLPNNIPYSAAQYYADQKKEWLLKKQKEMKDYFSQILCPEFKQGGTLYLFGQAYIIENIIDIQKRVELHESKIKIYSHKKLDEQSIKTILEKWLKSQLIKEVKISVERGLQRFNETLNYTNFRIRKMKRSWGNMRKNGMMTLNLSLIHTPKECIEFVIVHELCHLKYFNHSKKFYILMDNVMSEWRKYDRKLDQYSPFSY